MMTDDSSVWNQQRLIHQKLISTKYLHTFMGIAYTSTALHINERMYVVHIHFVQMIVWNESATVVLLQWTWTRSKKIKKNYQKIYDNRIYSIATEHFHSNTWRWWIGFFSHSQWDLQLHGVRFVLLSSSFLRLAIVQMHAMRSFLSFCFS